MELTLLVYGLGLISKIEVISWLVLIGLMVAIGITFIYTNVEHGSRLTSSTEGSEQHERAKLAIATNHENIKRMFVAAITTLFILMAVPSEKTAYTMVAAYAVQKVATHPSVEVMNEKVLRIINQKLDEYVAKPN